MRVVITNAKGRQEIVAEVLMEHVSQHISISNIEILAPGECEKIINEFGMGTLYEVMLSGWVSFDLKSELDSFPEDYQMIIFTNLFEHTDLEFWIPQTGFSWGHSL